MITGNHSTIVFTKYNLQFILIIEIEKFCRTDLHSEMNYQIFWLSFMSFVLTVFAGGMYRNIYIEKINSTNPNIIEVLALSYTERSLNISMMIKKPLHQIRVSLSELFI